MWKTTWMWLLGVVMRMANSVKVEEEGFAVDNENEPAPENIPTLNDPNICCYLQVQETFWFNSEASTSHNNTAPAFKHPIQPSCQWSEWCFPQQAYAGLIHQSEVGLLFGWGAHFSLKKDVDLPLRNVCSKKETSSNGKWIAFNLLQLEWNGKCSQSSLYKGRTNHSERKIFG